MTASFVWKVTCRSGVIAFGSHADFLICIFHARQEKVRLAALLPHSTFRVQFLAPNGRRVSRIDIRAALHALANTRIGAVVFARMAMSADVPPAAQARTERTADIAGDLATSAQSAFCQAGVVAPPDSPDLGNSVVADSDHLSV